MSSSGSVVLDRPADLLSSCTATGYRLVAIAPNVPDAHILAEGVLSNTTVLRLTSDTDAIDQITNALQQHPQTTSLHIISHGAPGTLYLGETELSLTTLDSYGNQLQQWSSLANLEQILLYGCQVALGDSGEEFVAKLHVLTNIPLAASHTLTGNITQGGNWQLEKRTNNFQPQVAIAPEILNTYPHTLGNFRIVSLSSDNATVLDHALITDDDRGGIALSDTNVFVVGDRATGYFDLELPRDPAGSFSTRYDGIFNDIETGILYTLGTDSTTPFSSGDATITHLLRINEFSGNLNGTSIALDSPINVASNDSGVFAGAGRVVIYDNDTGNFYDIDLASGNVANLGNAATPNLDGSENWADWGVAEFFGGELYVTYRSDSGDEIERLRLSDGTASTLASFDDLSDLSSFTVSPQTGRWYFHHESDSQFGGAEETVGYADATFAASAPGELQILTLTGDNSAVIDHEDFTGDDRGGIAVSNSQVFVTGDGTTAYIDLELPNVGIGNSYPRYDGIFSDIETATLYTLGTDATTPFSRGDDTITHLLGLNVDTGQLDGTSIALDSPISVDSGSGVFAGAGRVVIYDGDTGNFYDIDLASGTVTNLGNTASPNLYGSENWADWGVAEFFGGELYVTYRSDSGDEIERLRLSDGTTSTLASFDDLDDLASFTVSPQTGRWYFHHEDGSQFGGAEETVGYADATFAASVPGELQILTLTGNNSAVIDHEDLTGDDRGGIAISDSEVFVVGDGATGSVPLNLFRPATRIYDGIFGDIATGSVYALATDSVTPLENASGIVAVTHLLGLDSETGALTGNDITLSIPIQLDTDSTNGASAIFAGHERVVIYDNASEVFYDIELPSGNVSILETSGTPDLYGGENWADWGIAEYFDDTLYVSYRNSTNNNEIERLNLADGSREVLATFDNISDLSSFSVSPETGRWYFHYEGTGGQFDPGNSIEELVGFADAVFEFPESDTGLIPQGNNLLTVDSAQPRLKVTQLSGAPGEIYEIAVVETAMDGSINGVESDASGYLNEVLNNASSLLSTLADDDISNLNPSRLFEVTEGSNLQFILIQNGTLDSLLNNGVGDVSFGLLTEENQSPVSFMASADNQTVDVTFQPSGVDIPVILQMALTDETPVIGTGLQGTVEGEMIDLRAETGELTVNIEVYREAALDNLVGFYQVENEQGQVFDEFGNLLNPGDDGYVKAAMQQSVAELSLSGENGTVITSTATMMAGKLLSTFIIVDGTTEQLLDSDMANDPTVYFNHLGANTDGQDHVRLMGDNTFGFEDMVGGGDMDFDDVIARVSFV
ncbi:MAG: DUF4347 domain-containing protein [Cyanobacteria bacterium J06627_3]